jgi:hypothetical protein
LGPSKKNIKKNVLSSLSPATVAVVVQPPTATAGQLQQLAGCSWLVKNYNFFNFFLFLFFQLFYLFSLNKKNVFKLFDSRTRLA